MTDRTSEFSASLAGADGSLIDTLHDTLTRLMLGSADSSGMYLMGLFSDMTIMSMLALSAYLLLLVGRISFGQQAFFGIGAYAAGVMSVMFHAPLVLALATGVLAGALFSWLLALPTMHLAGLHYAIATLAFAEMARITLGWWIWQRPAEDGPVGPAGIEGFRDIRWCLENDVAPGEYLALTVALLMLVLCLLMLLERIRLGIALRMTGQDDVLAASQGIDTARVRQFAAAMAGALAALGGGLYAHRTTYVEPALFDPMLGVHAVGYALLGGLGSALGPLLGVLLDLGLLDATRWFQGWRMVVFGGLVALILRWRPRGLLDESLALHLAGAMRRIWRMRPRASSA